MADKTKSFSDLVSEAPLAANEDTVSLTGALARSNQPGKFVLLTQGGSITLDESAVKSHQVLGGNVGQTLVQVEVDKTQVPQAAMESTGQQPIPTTGIVDLKHPSLEKHPAFEKHPVFDKFPYFDKAPWHDLGTAPVVDHPPFALATAQQAPAEALSALQAVQGGGTRTFFSWDINTGFRDVKHPFQDGTSGHHLDF